MKFRLAALLLAALAPAAPAAAATVFDNGGIVPTNSTWNASGAYAAYDDFLLAAPTRITDIVFSFFGMTSAAPGDFAIYGNDRTTLVFGPSSHSGYATVDNGLGSGNPNVPDGYTRTISGLDMTLDAGTYFLGIAFTSGNVAIASGDGGPGTSFAGGTAGLLQLVPPRLGLADPYVLRNGDHMSFSLAGEPVAAAVPLPLAGPLLILSIGGLALIRARRT